MNDYMIEFVKDLRAAAKRLEALAERVEANPAQLDEYHLSEMLGSIGEDLTEIVPTDDEINGDRG